MMDRTLSMWRLLRGGPNGPHDDGSYTADQLWIVLRFSVEFGCQLMHNVVDDRLAIGRRFWDWLMMTLHTGEAYEAA